jgi:hypothetical protein
VLRPECVAVRDRILGVALPSSRRRDGSAACIFFAPGRYDPQSESGGQLLRHELTHVVQQGHARIADPDRIPVGDRATAAEGEARAVSGDPRRVSPASGSVGPAAVAQCLERPDTQPPASTQPPAARTPFESFKRMVQRRFGVGTVRVGTQAEQTDSVTPAAAGGAPAQPVVLPDWQRWEPDTEVSYQAILDAIPDVADKFGGFPAISEIVFCEMYYQWDSKAGKAVPDPNTAASFGSGRLTVYHAIERTNKGLPMARSNPERKYPSMPVAGLADQGGAPVPLPTHDQTARRAIAHEVGHGLEEAAIGRAKTGPDPTLAEDVALAVGWWQPGAAQPQLFDIGDKQAAAAIATGKQPAAQPITAKDWNSPKWIEQPISGYAVTHPAEDFAESVMAYVHAPQVLASRSPTRYKFLDIRKARWLPALQQQRERPVDDPPLETGKTRVA